MTQELLRKDREEPTSPRELIMVARADFQLRVTPEGVDSAIGADVGSLAELVAREGLVLRPLFGTTEDRLQAEAEALARDTGEDAPDLSVFYKIEAAEEQLDALAERLLETDAVETAYVKPPTEPAHLLLNDMEPLADPAPTVTPDFEARQDYLDPAPVGVNAYHAWTVPGGRGHNVRIIDIERGWNFAHEDLTANQGGVIAGTNATNNDHGTAVIGEIGGDVNKFGIVGISPEAQVSGVSRLPDGTAVAIHTAANHLSAGDIILIEVHRGGPNYNTGDWTRFGYIPIEWWPDDLAAIRYAVRKGIIVVEAAGNGGQNLDDAVYETNPAPPLGPFPAWWRNPLNPANRGSGAVLVGAGLPPAGTHGRNHEPTFGDVYADRGRCYFSNYGARVDAQGWGWEVTTTGYGDLQGGDDKNQWYTDTFSGTSSASPIVVGALACVQGVRHANGSTLMTPREARMLLRAKGSPQEEAPGFAFIPNMAGTGYSQNHPVRPVTERIGKRPDLAELISPVIAHEVGSYSVLMITGYGNANQIGFVYFYTPAGKYVGYVGIIKDAAPLPTNTVWPNGILNIYFHEAELVALLDTLRNEKPVFVKYHTILKWGSVGTGREPVGEQEVPATP